MPKREKDTWANQLVDIVGAVKLLSRHNGATNEDLISELVIGSRTVFRLKKTLENMGIPLEEVESNSGCKRWKIPAEWTMTFPKTNSIGLTTPELLALYALRVSKGLYRGSSINLDLDVAFEKIGTALSPATRSMLERYSSVFISVPNATKDYSNSAEVIEEISLAIIDRTTCTIDYHSFSDDKVKKFDINPLHLFERDGGLYLLVVTTDYGDVRTLAIERIRKIDPVDKTFVYPDQFDPESYLATAFTLYFGETVEVKIRFAADQSRYIRERQWANKQKIIDEPDGSVILILKTSGWWDIKRWALSFGADAEVLEPAKMREEIKNDLSVSSRKYYAQ